MRAERQGERDTEGVGEGTGGEKLPKVASSGGGVVSALIGA